MKREKYFKIPGSGVQRIMRVLRKKKDELQGAKVTTILNCHLV
jgi:hypothetical protein